MNGAKSNLVASQDKYIWLNGQLLAYSDAMIHALTHSLHYAGAVFEGERAYNGRIFKLEEHVSRLLKSAQVMLIEPPFTFDQIIEAHYLLLEANNIKDAYIRPLIWLGPESLNLVNQKLSVNMLIASAPLLSKNNKSLSLHISRWRKASPLAMPVQCKASASYHMFALCKKEAKSQGYDDAIMLDEFGYITEATTSNIFFVKENNLYTPTTDNCLDGITRQTVIEIAKRLGINVFINNIKPSEIEYFTEAFLTGTSAEITSIANINNGNDNIIFQSNEISQMIRENYLAIVQN